MMMILKSKNQFSEEYISNLEQFFQEKIQIVFWGNSFNFVDFEKALSDARKDEKMTTEAEESSVIVMDYVDEDGLKKIISDIEQSKKTFPPLVFDPVTWSIFRQYMPVIPVVTSLGNEYNQVKELIEKSPMVYFVNREEYLVFRDDHVNTAWLCQREVKQKKGLSYSLLRISRQTDRKKLFKGLALTRKLKKLGLPIRGIVCDDENSEMLFLIHSYFPDLPVIDAKDVSIKYDLSLYLYEPSVQMMNPLEFVLHFQSYTSSLKNESLYSMDISNRDLDTIVLLIKDSLVNFEKYQLISDKKRFEDSWNKGQKKYSNEKICVNTIEKIIKIDEMKIELDGYLIFDKTIMHKEFNLQIMLVHQSTGEAFSVPITFQAEEEKIQYTVEVDFNDLDFFKGKFEVVVCYDSWNLRYFEKVSFENNFSKEPITFLTVHSRNIEALVDFEGKLFFQVSAYQIN